MSTEKTPATGSQRISLVRSARTATLCASLLGAYVLVSESLQLTLRNPQFLSNLGTQLLTVVAVYLGFAIVLGLVFSPLLRAPQWQSLVVAVVYYVILSLKLFWLESKMLANPMVAAIFGVFSLVIFVALPRLRARFALSVSTPSLFVVAYLNVCALTASTWTETGGSLVAFLFSTRTLVVCALAAALFVTAVLLHSSAEKRGRRTWPFHAAALLGLFAGAAIANRGEGQKRFAVVATSAERPDLYVVSFDALRRDKLMAFVKANPSSTFAKITNDGIAFANVVTDGSSTYPILANNTFAGARRGDCAGSLPGRLRERGYTSIFLLSRAGKRFDGSECYDQFYSGTGEELVNQYKLLALASEVWGSGSSAMRARMIRSSVLIGELEQRVKGLGARPAFTYIHLLDFHEPYVPRHREHDESYLSALSQWEARCFARGCDAADPEIARLTSIVRGAYEELFVETDELLARILGFAASRGRDFRVVLMADHGELFGEHNGFLHGGGFVPELLNIPFVLYRPRAATPGQARCNLLLGSEALRSALLEEQFPDRDSVTVSSALGRATVSRASGSLSYEVHPPNRPHARTWRNVHPDASGTIPYPLEVCTAQDDH